MRCNIFRPARPRQVSATDLANGGTLEGTQNTQNMQKVHGQNAAYEQQKQEAAVQFQRSQSELQARPARSCALPRPCALPRRVLILPCFP